MLARGRLSSLILWGPPGTGKTTIARLLAGRAGLEFAPVSAIYTGVAELRKVFEAAKARRLAGKGTLLFVDEIHRFNRAQQDSFLPVVEDAALAEGEPVVPAPLSRPVERILFVDDDSDFFEAGKQMLMGLGYEVVSHDNSLEALAEFEAQPDSFDLVISDMAPKTSGQRHADQYRSYELAMRALGLAKAVLEPGGGFVAKIFQGAEFEEARNAVREAFSKVRTIRPEATRDESYEVFLVGLCFRPTIS